MFETEIGYVKNPVIKQMAVNVLANVPEYFYHVPASSTGKYHSAYALGEGGLYRHVQAAVRIAHYQLELESCDFTDNEKDMIIVALIFHDGWKQGLDSKGSTIHEHPVVAAEMFVEFCGGDLLDKNVEIVYNISSNIASHMGQWNTNKYSKEVLPKPITPMQKFVHACDYLASRKDIEVLF